MVWVVMDQFLNVHHAFGFHESSIAFQVLQGIIDGNLRRYSLKCRNVFSF